MGAVVGIPAVGFGFKPLRSPRADWAVFNAALKDVEKSYRVEKARECEFFSVERLLLLFKRIVFAGEDPN